MNTTAVPLQSQSSPIMSCHLKELTSNLQQSDLVAAAGSHRMLGGFALQPTLKQQVSCSKQLDP